MERVKKSEFESIESFNDISPTLSNYVNTTKFGDTIAKLEKSTVIELMKLNNNIDKLNEELESKNKELNHIKESLESVTSEKEELKEKLLNRINDYNEEVFKCKEKSELIIKLKKNNTSIMNKYDDLKHFCIISSFISIIELIIIIILL